MSQPGEIRLLSVGNEAGLAESLEKTDERFVVETVGTASGGLARVADEDIDCVLVAHEPPEMDGIAFLEGVRESTADTPVVLYTDMPPEAVASEALAAGATDYVQKRGGNVQYELLASRVRNAVGSGDGVDSVDRSPEDDEWFRELDENLQDVVWISDPDKQAMLYVSEAYEEIWGRPTDALYETPTAFLDAVHPDDSERVRAAVESQASGGYDEEYRIVRPDGEVRWVHDRAVPVTDNAGNVHRVVGITSDVTERKRKERKWRRVTKRVTDAIVEIDEDWQFTLVNEQAEELYGMTESELLGRDFWEVFAAAKGTRFEEEYRRVMETREPTSFVEYFSQLDGWFDITVYPKDDGGLAFYFLDVTEQRERRHELQETNLLLSTLFEILPVGVTVIEPDGTIAQANERAEEVLGLEESEIVGRTYSDPSWKIFDENGDPIPDDGLPFAQVMETGEAIFDHEHGVKWPDGTERWLSINAVPMRGVENDEIQQVVAAILDRTKTHEYEQMIERRNERLENIAGIISHDLRNPLNVAQLRLELLADDCESEHIDDLESAHERMETLIAEILELVKDTQADIDPTTVDLAPFVDNCWENVETKNATLVTATDRTVRADEDRLCHVFENLFRNSLDHGGDDVTVTVGTVDGGFYVADDGPGIPPEERDEVFETGYSTRDEGTGFGLSIVEQVVDAHDWEVRVTESDEGGARFEVTGVE